ncbi:MAG: hypothetical protein JWM09_1293 [Francisellaceae bacterium]|nr:hypothetical protein [Francisellaceae bacterium]
MKLIKAQNKLKEKELKKRESHHNKQLERCKKNSIKMQAIYEIQRRGCTLKKFNKLKEKLVELELKDKEFCRNF